MGLAALVATSPVPRARHTAAHFVPQHCCQMVHLQTPGKHGVLMRTFTQSARWREVPVGFCFHTGSCTHGTMRVHPAMKSSAHLSPQSGSKTAALTSRPMYGSVCHGARLCGGAGCCSARRFFEA